MPVLAILAGAFSYVARVSGIARRFYGFELATAVEQCANVKVILGNDVAWGVERRLQRSHYGRTVAADLPDIPYHELAKNLGAQALLVENVAELNAAVDQMVASRGPFLLHVKLMRDVGRPFM